LEDIVQRKTDVYLFPSVKKQTCRDERRKTERIRRGKVGAQSSARKKFTTDLQEGRSNGRTQRRTGSSSEGSSAPKTLPIYPSEALEGGKGDLDFGIQRLSVFGENQEEEGITRGKEDKNFWGRKTIFKLNGHLGHNPNVAWGNKLGGKSGFNHPDTGI